jgi:hypothetical protein
MKQHLTEGELRASLDGELDHDQFHHLESCAECQTCQSQIQVEHLRAAKRLAFLAPANESVPSVSAVWSKSPHHLMKQKETSMFKKIFAFPVVRTGVVAIFALAMLLAFPTTRAFASKLLNLFRVQQVAVLPIDMSGMESLTGNEALGNKMSELMSNSTEVTKEAMEPVTVANASEASNAAGFEVRLPKDMAASTIIVSDSSAFTINIDLAKIQALLDEAGRSDLILAETMDGAEISMDIPASVNATFGNCPEFNADSNEFNGERPSSMNARYEDCLVFGQIPSPVVQAPADVNMAELAQLALEFSGMSREEAATLADTVDWTSTLVVPLPRDAATYSDVNVDGVTGSLIQGDSEYAPQFALLWVKDGVVYFISGSGTDTSRAFDFVNALP